MPIYEFTCTECEHEHEEFVKLGTQAHDCPQCGATSHKVIRSAPEINWGAMGAQRNAGPEFIDRFERVHRQQKEKEEKLAKGE